MNRAEALTAVKAFDPTAILDLAEDDITDDQITLRGNPEIAVQICCTRDGLVFSASVGSGEGDDYGVRFGTIHTDPVKAAAQAVDFAQRDGLL